jgi:hypothetical protein
VLEILDNNLIALFCSLKTFLRFLTFPQNKIPYFKDECMYAKYIVPVSLYYGSGVCMTICGAGIASDSTSVLVVHLFNKAL